QEDHEGNILEAVRNRTEVGEYKILTANPGNPRALPPVELFRVDEDPQESRDLKGKQPEDLRRNMETLVLAAQQAKRGSASIRKLDMHLSREAVSRLRTLGYAGE